MSNVQTILDALLVNTTPNTSSQYAEDTLARQRQNLVDLLRGRLADEPAMQDMVKKYLENPTVWESNLAEALQKADLVDDARVMEAAEELLRAAEPYEPERPDLDPPTTVPGVMADDKL